MQNINGPGNTGNRPNPNQLDRGPGEANHQDIDRFKAAAKERRANKDRANEEGKNKADGGEGQSKSADDRPLTPGEAMLRNMQAQSGKQGGANPMMGNIAQAAKAESVGELVKEIADKIMVGAKGTAGEGEIRIQLKADILDGAELRMKEVGGRLEISFVTKTADAQQVLNARMGELKNELSGKLDKEIVIDVASQDEMERQEQQDRRSRQQYAMDEDED